MDYIVYMKSNEQILKEREKFEVSAKREGRLPYEVCPTYIKNERGNNVDTWALSPEQVAYFVIEQSKQEHDLDIMRCLNVGKHRCKYPDQKITTASQLKHLLDLTTQVENPQAFFDVIKPLDTNGLLESTQSFVNALSKSGYPEVTVYDIVDFLAEHDRKKDGFEKD